MLDRCREIRQMHSNLTDVSTKRQRITELARTRPEVVFTSLAHLIDLDWLDEAYRRTRKDGAAGVDDVTGKEYAENLHENLQNLLDRLKSGTYRAPPVRRKHIPKGTSGETRPIGIPTFEDKIAQRAVAMLLEPIYEHDFHDGSYGFRPKRNAHQAIQAVWETTMSMSGGWVLEVDLRKFFDTLDHGRLQEFVSRRVRDGVLRRLIGKWLNAGVMDGDELSFSESGSPQGGVISPLLANIYLHYVLDEWFERQVKPLMRGRCRLIRYADDFVIVFARKDDADRVMKVIPLRFEKYGLSVHSEKTKLLDFRSPNHWERRRDAASQDEATRRARPMSFDLLGFSHFWRKDRKGAWVVGRKTMKSRLARGLRSIDQWCRDHRHWPVKEQWKKLCEKVRGHYGYYGITGNVMSLGRFWHEVKRRWRHWLNRRNTENAMTWELFERLYRHYPLPLPRVARSVFKSSGRIT